MRMGSRWLLVAVALTAVLAGDAWGKRDAKASQQRLADGVKAMSSGKLLDAEVAFNEALELDAKNHAAAYNLGLVHEQQKRWTDAAKDYARAVKLAPKQATYHARQGHAELVLEHWDAARKALARAVKLDKQLAAAHHDLGVVLAGDGDFDAAGRAYADCVCADPTLGACWLAHGLIRDGKDDLAAAIPLFETGLQKAADRGSVRRDLFVALGRAFLDVGRAADAVTTLEKAVELRADDSEAAVLLAVALAASGDKPAARARLKKLEKTYDLAPIWLTWARAAVENPPAARSTAAPIARAKGSLIPVDLRPPSRKHLGKTISVRGYVVYVYDCARELGAKVAKDEPERCDRPHFYLADTADASPDRSLWVVDVPRAPSEEAPELTVGGIVVVEGTWATRSPKGFINSGGLLIYGKMPRSM